MNFKRCGYTLVTVFILLAVSVVATDSLTSSEAVATKLMLDQQPKVHTIINTFKEQKPQESVDVILRVEKGKLEAMRRLLEQHATGVQKYEVGGVIKARIPSHLVDELAVLDDIKEISPEFEYAAFLDESIPALGISSMWDAGFTGEGIKIAILDTGIADHVMVRDRVIASESFVDSNPLDEHGHGTHVAGIAAGDGLYKGVAPDAQLLNTKVLDERGRGTSSGIIAGINWAVDNGADIISMSFGSNDDDGPVAAALQDAMEQGVVVAAVAAIVHHRVHQLLLRLRVHLSQSRY